MLTAAHFQEVSSRREDRRTKMHIVRSWSYCNEESIEILGLQSGVGGDQLRPRLARQAERGTAVPSRACTNTPPCTAWRWRVVEHPTSAVRRGRCASDPDRTSKTVTRNLFGEVFFQTAYPFLFSCLSPYLPFFRSLLHSFSTKLPLKSSWRIWGAL